MSFSLLVLLLLPWTCKSSESFASISISSGRRTSDGVQYFRIDIRPEDGSPAFNVWKRFREFFSLSKDLGDEAEALEGAPFPPKIWFGMNAAQLELRRSQLEVWFQKVMRHPNSKLHWASFLNSFLGIDNEVNAHRSEISMPPDAYLICDLDTHYYGIDWSLPDNKIVRSWHRYSEFEAFKQQLGPAADTIRAQFPPKHYFFNSGEYVLAPRRRALEAWLRGVMAHPNSKMNGPWQAPLKEFLDPSQPLVSCPWTWKSVAIAIVIVDEINQLSKK